jgi:cytochrome o ubiquinol oxidase operon protein cyoD
MSSTDESDRANLSGHDFEDLAPGEEHHEEVGIAEGIRGYVLGFLLAAGLTVASFYVWAAHPVWEPAIPAALVTLAIAQMGIHIVFFLHLTTGPDNTNNVLALAFGVLAVGLILGGSVWIMAHLNQHMMTLQNMPGSSGGAAMSMQP